MIVRLHLMPVRSLKRNTDLSPPVDGYEFWSMRGMMTNGYSSPLDLCRVWMMTALLRGSPSTSYLASVSISDSMILIRSEMVIRELRWDDDSMVVMACVISLSQP